MKFVFKFFFKINTYLTPSSKAKQNYTRACIEILAILFVVNFPFHEIHYDPGAVAMSLST